MGLNFEDLDSITRKFMLEEIRADTQADKVYRSSYLTQSGQGNWPDLILVAAQTGNDDTLASSANGQFNSTTQRKKPKGFGYYTAAVPVNAAQMLAESEFNRYFVRGLCLRAMDEGIPRLEVYRAKQVSQPRPESESKIGLLVDPQTVLIDVRASQSNGVETALGIPPGPGSGITIRIPKK
ncbi:hypothetical protein [Tardiphaga robiniae]|uniref:Uncharacterized protein n=1 Tax=Tardiphaga robiniae TaxID=943830 RepID=A0A164A242_9BRAD|nr:hypothetical protein [Tardiphaga robiniae]KZD24146.1 hypothetical protein A4A58_23635 [Tardiphaga robiniae]